MGSFKVNIMVSIMVRQILTKNSFKSRNGLVISPILQDFLSNFYYFKYWNRYTTKSWLIQTVAPLLPSGWKENLKIYNNFETTLNKMDPYPVDLNKRVEDIEEDKSNDDINETEDTPEILHMGTSRTVEKKLNKKDKTNKIKNTNCDKLNKLKCNEVSQRI